jgi:hypothetical protein
MGQLNSLSPPVQTESPQNVGQSARQFHTSSFGISQMPLPHVAPQSLEQDHVLSEPEQRPSPHQPQSFEQDADDSEPVQIPSPHLEQSMLHDTADSLLVLHLPSPQ